MVPRLRFGKGVDKLTAEGWFADIESIVERTLFERSNWSAKIPKTKRIGPVETQKGLIPITVSETPWFIAVDTTPASGGTIGQVVSVSDFPEHNVVIADTLTEFITRLVDGFANDLYCLDDEGYLAEP